MPYLHRKRPGGSARHYRNAAYPCFALAGLAWCVGDAISSLPHHSLGAVIGMAVVFIPWFAFCLRALLVQVRADENGVRVVNFWRTHTVVWGDIKDFSAATAGSRTGSRTGKKAVWMTMARVELHDGGEILATALSRASSGRAVTPGLQQKVSCLNHELARHR